MDNKTRTMPVELDVRDSRAELNPGMFCEVSWPVRRDYSTLFVPASAVANDLERAFVIRIENNKVKWVDVKTGADIGEPHRSFGDLKEGDQVATRGTDQIRPGATVAPPTWLPHRSPRGGGAFVGTILKKKRGSQEHETSLPVLVQTNARCGRRGADSSCRRLDISDAGDPEVH